MRQERKRAIRDGHEEGAVEGDHVVDLGAVDEEEEVVEEDELDHGGGANDGARADIEGTHVATMRLEEELREVREDKERVERGT